MIKIRDFEGFTDAYPQPVSGTNEWYYCKQYRGYACDLYQVIGFREEDGTFAGSTCNLLHVPTGKVYCPFEIKENVYVEEPVWDDGKLAFLVVDFEVKYIQIYHFIPEDESVLLLAELPFNRDSEIDDIKLKTTPLMLGRDNRDRKVYEIIWPEEKAISVDVWERILCRDGDTLYFEEGDWPEDGDFREWIVSRDLNTGEIIERFLGSMTQMPDGSYWRIKLQSKE